MRQVTAILTVLVTALPLAAQERGEGALTLGADVFRAGRTVIHSAAGADTVFLAGERVRLGAEVAGSAHLAGRRVELAAPVGGDLYGAGMDVTVTAPVAGSATLAGYDIQLAAEVGGGLRATGGTVRVAAPVGGPAVIAGRTVALEAPMAGDVALAAERLSFGPAAAIGGRLVLYGDAAQMAAVPASVVPAERIELRAPRDRDDRRWPMRAPTAAMAVGGFVVAVGVLALFGFVAALIAPVGINALRDEVGARPFRTLGVGFLTLSALIGAAVVVALTIIGIFLAPAVLFAALLIGFAGYVVAVYMLGAGILERARRDEPDTLGERALAALIGAVVASLIFLVPVLGWLFMLGAVLIGMGALAGAALRSRAPG